MRPAHVLILLVLITGAFACSGSDDGDSSPGAMMDAGGQEADSSSDTSGVADMATSPNDSGEAPDTSEPLDSATPDTTEAPDTTELSDTDGVSDTMEVPDTGEAPDSSTPDTDEPDVDEPDVEPDAGAEVPLMGFGSLSGDCGVLDEELTASGSAFVRNTIDFGAMPYTEDELERLTEGGQEIIADGNAGGSSLLSEVFAYEVLHRCELASLLKTETEIVYVDPNGKLTDLLVELDELKIGVSVTRAVGFPRDDPYTVERARELLIDKLDDVAASSANVSEEDAWVKQILHVIAYAPQHADSMMEAWEGLAPEVLGDTVLVVTVSEGDDAFLY